jgi:hypothetical protein
MFLLQCIVPYFFPPSSSCASSCACASERSSTVAHLVAAIIAQCLTERNALYSTRAAALQRAGARTVALLRRSQTTQPCGRRSSVAAQRHGYHSGAAGCAVKAAQQHYGRSGAPMHLSAAGAMAGGPAEVLRRPKWRSGEAEVPRLRGPGRSGAAERLGGPGPSNRRRG